MLVNQGIIFYESCCMSSASQNKALKLFVGSLFLVLLGGAILLFLIASGKLGDANPLNIAKQSMPVQAVCLKDKELVVKNYGNPISASIEGNLVRMVLKKDESHFTVATVDGCTGEVQGLLKVKTE